jgi:hypothetical protein
MFWKKYGLWILLAIAIAIKVFSLYPQAVENYYAQGIYPFIVIILRTLFGWIPFSIGDVLYGLAVLYLLKGLFKLTKRLLQRNTGRQYWVTLGRKALAIALWVYILFNGLWGLNYNRQGIAKQLGIQVTKYTAEELTAVIDLTVQKLHQLEQNAAMRRDSFHKKQFLFRQAVNSYRSVLNRFSFLEYPRPSIKPSLYSYLGNYLGYTGYYNPFSGEAQVNTTVPLVLLPFTATHEIGHQLGFAKEHEANFAGFLAARTSPDAAVQYSVYFDLYIYAARNLALRDTAQVKKTYEQLPQLAKDDLKELKEFYRKYENPIEPIIRSLYGQYLRANEQPQGILSYDEVIAWIIAYYRKYREI